MKKIFILLCGAGLFTVSCTDKSKAPAVSAESATDTMYTEVVAVVKSYYEAFKMKDSVAIGGMIGPGYTEYGDGSTPPQKLTSDQVKTNMHRFLLSSPDYTVSNEEFFSNGKDKVVVTCTYQGTWTGDVNGMKATGKAYKAADADIYTVEKGKITSHKYIYPDSALFAQIGLDPSKMDEK